MLVPSFVTSTSSVFSLILLYSVTVRLRVRIKRPPAATLGMQPHRTCSRPRLPSPSTESTTRSGISISSGVSSWRYY